MLRAASACENPDAISSSRSIRDYRTELAVDISIADSPSAIVWKSGLHDSRSMASIRNPDQANPSGGASGSTWSPRHGFSRGTRFRVRFHLRSVAPNHNSGDCTGLRFLSSKYPQSVAGGLALAMIRSMRRLGCECAIMPIHVQNSIQERNRRRIPACIAPAGETTSHHTVRRNAFDPAQTAPSRVSVRKGLLGDLPALPRNLGEWG